MSRRRSLVHRLRRILDERRAREADLRPRRVVGRHRDGTEVLVPLDGECPERGSVGNRATGQVVLLPTPAPYRDRGFAGVAVAVEEAAAEILWVERQTPRRLEPGTTVTVRLFGRGFRPETWFEYRLPASDEPHPGLAILTRTFLDPETFELELEIAGDAQPVDGGPIAYARRTP